MGLLRDGIDAASLGAVIVGAYKPQADPFIRRVAEAVRAVAPEFGFPPQPTDRFVTAHAIVSTGWFDDDLSRLHNGVFGVKAGRSWTGPVALMKTGEYYTPEEVARAQGIPAGQRGSFVRYLDQGPDARGKRHVLIWDAFRKYASPEDAIRDHFRGLTGWKKSDGTLRYARSIEKLRAGAPDYMRQLGLDGWYTGDPDVTQRTWSSILDGSKLRTILAARGGGGGVERGGGGVARLGAWFVFGSGVALCLGIAVNEARR